MEIEEILTESAFDNEKDFSEHLKKLLLEEEESYVQNIIDHEKAHYEKAKELGYTPLFFIKERSSTQGNEQINRLDISVRINSAIWVWDKKKILLAPKNPSPSDLEKADNMLYYRILNFRPIKYLLKRFKK